MMMEADCKDERFYTPRQSARTVGSSSSDGERVSPRRGCVSESDTEFFSTAREAKGYTDERPGHFAESKDDLVENVFSFARHNRVDDIERLLARGIPPDVRDEYGNTVLIVACQNGHKRVAKAALRYGADINALNARGNSGLHFCFAYGYGDTLGQYLISKGADPAMLNSSGLTCYEGLSR